MTNQNDNVSKLYHGLIKKGYTQDELGDETKFRQRMSNDSNRRRFYDYVSGRGDFRLGDYETYESRLISSYEPSTEQGPAQQELTPYQPTPEEVQQYTLQNKPDIFKPKTGSLVDRAAGIEAQEQPTFEVPNVLKGITTKETVEDLNNTVANAYSTANQMGERMNARVDMLSKNLQDPEYLKSRNDVELRGLNSEIDDLLEKAVQEESTPVGGSAFMPAGARGRAYVEANKERVEDVTNLSSAKRLLEQSKYIADAARRGDTGVLSDTWQGFKDSLEVEDFTFGLADAASSAAILDAIKKVEKGETLTEAEDKLLRASAINMATQYYYANDLSRAYKAGQVSAESVPFMLEMAINPISSFGKASAKTLLNYGLKSFAKQVGKGLGKGIVSGTGIALTTGLGRVASGTTDRLSQGYNYGVDIDGNLFAEKKKDAMGVGEAFARSLTSTAIENQSEMIFNAFKGMGSFMKGVEKVLPGGVNKFFDMLSHNKVADAYRWLKNSPVFRNYLVKDVRNATQIGGIFEEYAEEVYNNLANFAIGEMSWEDVVSLDKNIDTFLGLAPTQVMFGILGLGGAASMRYQTRKTLEDLKATMNEQQRKELEGLLDMGIDAKEVDVRGFIRGVMENQNYTIENKRDLIKAAYYVAQQRSIDELTEADVIDKVNAENQFIDSMTDPSTGNYAELSRNVINPQTGESEQQKGYVVGWIGEGEKRQPIFVADGMDNNYANRVVLKPTEWSMDSYREMPAEQVKAVNEEMNREEAARQAERESKYAPEVLNAKMEQDVPFNTPTSQIVPVAPMPEGNGWIVEEYALDTNNKVAKTPIVRELTNDEYRDMLQAQIDAQEAAAPVNAPSGENVGEEVNAEVNAPVNNENVQPVAEGVATEQQVVQPQAPIIPTKEDGSIDFVSYGKEGTFKTLGEKYGEKMPNKVAITAKALAEDVKKAQKKLNKAEEAYDNAPIGREQKAEEVRDKAKAELEAIQREANFWAEMDAEIKEAQAVRESMLNPQAEVNTSSEPLTADEFVAQQLACGNIVLNKEDYKRETGYGDEEVEAMNGGSKKLLADNGMTIQEAGERLMEMDRENGTNFFDQSDPNAGRDELLSVLGSVKTRKELNQYVASNRAEQAKRDSEGLYNELERQVMDALYASLEDYVLQMEASEMENPFRDIDVAQIDVIFAEVEEEYQNYINNEQGTTSEIAEGSDNVLSEEQADNTGGTSGVESEGDSGRNGERTSEESERAYAATEELKQEEGETTLQFAERAAEENDRREPLRNRAREWAAKLGVTVNLIESVHDVYNLDALAAIQSGQRVTGWFEESTGEVCFYMPFLESESDVDATFIHEVVAHKGLRGLLGEKFDAFCDEVWDVMSNADRLKFMAYPGVSHLEGKKKSRAAADEYIAHLAENVDVTESAWSKLTELIKRFLKALGLEPKMTNADIANTIKKSYQRLLEGEVSVESVGNGTRFNAKRTSDRRQDMNRINNTVDQALSLVTGNDVKDIKAERVKKAQKRKEDAAEIYQSVLSGDFNDVTLQKINDYIDDATPLHPYGQRISQRLPQKLERGLHEGARTNAVDALFSRICESAVPASRRASEAGRREIEERKKEALKGWAIATNNWHTDLSDFADEEDFIRQGTDSKVYLAKDGKHVIKVSFGKPEGKRFRPDIDTTALFNSVFRNTAYEIVGYGEFDGKFARILKQPFVDFADKTALNADEREEYMRTLGFEPINDSRTAFSNGSIVAADLQKSNILKDAAGNISVIDADMKLHTKDVGGNYTYPPVEADLPEGKISFRAVKDKNELVAVHNISEDNLRKVLNVGGLIMPSIAITKADMGHEGYGEISLLFEKETINPADRRNKVYGGDAWTPRFPSTTAKINDKVSSKVYKKIKELIDDRSLKDLYSLSAELHADNIERTISDRGVGGYYDKEWMKLAYLLDNGKKVKIPMKMKDYGAMSEKILEMVKERGLKASDIQDGGYKFYQDNADIVEAVKRVEIENKLQSFPEEKRDALEKLLNEKDMTYSRFDSLISSAIRMEYDLENGGLKKIIDRAALRESIEKKVKTNNADYNKWVDNLFDGIVEKYGIRNNRDWYTPSGNLRPWEQLYDNATPANILKHMLAENEQGGSGGFFDSNIMGASAETYESIEEIREKGKKRLRRLEDGEYDEWSNSISERMSEICNEFLSPSQRKEFGAAIDAKIDITNAVAKDKTADGIYKAMKRKYPGFKKEHSKKVEEIVKEIQDFAIGYFEAKPRRIVPLNEVRKAIVPKKTSEDILEGLKNNGIEIATYKNGDETARARLIKKESDGIRFRIANKNQEIFVSNAQRAVEGIKQEKGTPQQWLAMIEKNGGLKAGEDKWLGLSDWLKGLDKKSVTKDEILNFIGENKIRIEEVTYGDWDNLDKRINSIRRDYTTQGIMNKQEIALTVPTIEPWDEDDEIHFGDAGEGRAVAWIRFGETSIPDKGLSEKSMMLGTEEWWNLSTEERNAFTEELMELKRNTIPTRVLVIDEIQSKRHQEGREKGYKSQADKTPARMEDLTFGEYNGLITATYKGERLYFSKEKSKEEILEMINERIADAQLGNANNLIPDAPFEKNWSELAFKRMLRYAAENGFDKVAWTTGAQQAERYNIGGVVSSINYFLRGDGSYRVETYGSNGYQIESIPTEFKDGQALADVFGKELATKMVKDLEEDRVKEEEAKKSKKEIRAKMRELDDESAEYESLLEEFGKYDSVQDTINAGHEISGDGLRVGGEGMKGFYDKMLPSFVNKYVKKWGTKVQDIELPNVEEAGRIMHSVDVTEAMKESVMEGQTMFRVVKDPAVDYISQAEDVVEVPRDEVMYTVNNIANQLYKVSGRFMRELYKYGTIGRVLKGEYAEIDQIKAKKEYDHAKPIFDEYLNELVWMKYQSTEAAQEVINDVISDVEYAMQYYKDLALGKDVWRTKNGPRFRISEKHRKDVSKAIADFTSSYNSKPVSYITNDMTDEQVDDLLEGYLDSEDVQRMKNEGAHGFYLRKTDRIYIFVDDIPLESVENSMFHENLHLLLGVNNPLTSVLWDKVKDKPNKFIEVLKNSYRSDEWAEEYFVYHMAKGLSEGELEKFISNFAEADKEALFNILNTLGYEYESESRERLGQRRRIRATSNSLQQGGKSGERRSGESREAFARKAEERKERLQQLFGRVADMGLDGVLGNKEYVNAMVDMYKVLPEAVQREVADEALSRYGGDVAPAVSDWLNHKAEASVWDKVVAVIREALRNVGFDLDLNTNESKYILWRSQKPINRNNLLEMAEDIDMRYRLKVGEYEDSPTRFRSIEEVNDDYNRRLDELDNDRNQKDRVLRLGKPGRFLTDGGVSGSEIEMEFDKFVRKSNDNYVNDHPFTAGDIKNLPKAINAPIAVFDSTNHKDKVILTELKKEDNNFIVVIKATQRRRKGGVVLEVNEISTLYPKNAKGIIKWINDGLITNVDKRKALDWLEALHTHRGTGLINQELDSATKIVESFENPKIEGENVRKNGGGTRFRVNIGNKLNVRDEYESTIKKGGFQAREAVQDAMLSLRKFQELIEKVSGKKIRDFENAWMHENRLSSVVQAQIHEMERKFYKPMMDAVKKLMAVASLEQEQVADYLMLKHGIERNREMAVRKALTDSEGKIDRTRLEQWYQDKRNVRSRAATPHLDTWRKQQEELDNIALMYGADMSRDYSGLTSMFGTDDLADSTQQAYDEVEALEMAHPAETEALGKAIKAMTQNTLDESFASGLMDRKVYDELSKDMYDYYIPLRGFDETTSEEVYAYLDQDRGAFNAPLKRAKGRSSKSDNPIAYLKSIAESGIMQGERNKMKQSFLNLVINNPSDLVSVREGVWAFYNPASGEWEAAAPPAIPNNATPADVEAAMEAWEANMESLAASDPNVKKVSEAQDIPYRVVGNRMNQHQVIVKRLGKSYTLTINGNPRLAMALNGLTNPNNKSNDGKVAAYVGGKIDSLNRTLSAWYTTRNPDFVASNFMRDTFYTNTIVRAKEGNAYANKFHKNYGKVLPQMLILFSKYEKGTLNPADKTEAAFLDFMMNGGETGYSNLKDLEHIKKQIAKELKGNRFAKVEALAEKLDILNRAVENTARFAAFLTSREEGRSIAKSVFDAKEISVNFNKKGAGGTFFGMTGQTWFGNLAAMVGAGGRALYVFFNAAVQGTTNLMHVMKVNPKGTSAGLAAMFLMGAVVPFLFGGDDDDEKDYYDLPEHVRRNHLIVPGAGDAWVSFPLPIEYRIMYGMGELLTSWRTGHERGSDIARKMLNLTGQALPLNFLEEGLDAFVPSAISPIWQVYNNRSWTGLPIYKDNEFNKDDPEYTKAFKNTDRGLVKFTKALYEWTFDEENQEDGINLNPAVIETLAKGYFGGLATQLSNIMKVGGMIAGEQEFDWRNIPIGNRILKTGDERTKEKRVTNEYFKNMEQLDFLQSRERMLKKAEKGVAVPEADKFKAQKDLETMQGTEVYKKYQEFKKQKKVVDKIRKTIKEKGSTPELEKKLMDAQEAANKAVR